MDRHSFASADHAVSGQQEHLVVGTELVDHPVTAFERQSQKRKLLPDMLHVAITLTGSEQGLDPRDVVISATSPVRRKPPRPWVGRCPHHVHGAFLSLERAVRNIKG